METSKIKMKVGIHEIEAEGPTEFVKDQLEAFKELIRSVPAINSATTSVNFEQGTKNEKDTNTGPHVDLEKILQVNGRIVSLTALPTSVEDAALLIMLGHKDLRNNISVTGQEIGDGLAQSGRPVPRVDRILESAISEAAVLKTGIKRATRYRLTNQGLVKALGLARDLLATLP